MNIQKEQFREFEIKRLLFMSPPEGGPENQGATEIVIPPNAEILEAAESSEGSKEAAIKKVKQTEDKGDVAVDSADVDPEKTKDAVKKTIEQTNGDPEEKVESTKKSPRLSPDTILGSLFDDPQIRFEIMEFIGMPKDQANSINKQNFVRTLKMHRNFSQMLSSLSEVDATEPFELNKENRKIIVKAIGQGTNTESLDNYTTEEINILKKAITNFEGGATLEALLGEEGLALLSMNYEIKADEKSGAVKIKINDEWVTINNQKSLDTLISTLPKHIQEAYTDKVNAPDAYKETLLSELKANKSIINLKEAIEGGEASPSKEKGWQDYLKIFAELLPMIKKAMAGDQAAMQDLMDGWEHYEKTKESPLDAIANAKDAYTGKVNEIVATGDIDQLLSLHANPTSDEADKLFYTAEGPLKFRSQLSSVIEAQLGKTIGIDISKMSGNSIEGYKNGRRFTVSLDKNPAGENEAIFVEMGKDGPKAQNRSTYTNLSKLSENFRNFMYAPNTNPADLTEDGDEVVIEGQQSEKTNK